MGTMIAAAAGRIADINNPELRDVLAYVLDEVDTWLMHFGTETGIKGQIFAEEDTAARAVLQPVFGWTGWYIHRPFARWIGTLQEASGDGGLRWRFDRAFLAPWRYAPRLREESSMLARFAARRSWWNADIFIAEYVAAAAERLADDSYGTPIFFSMPGSGSGWGTDVQTLDDEGDELGRACYQYSLRVLAEMARDEEAMDEDGMGEFADALAEAIRLGMLWD